MKVNDETKEQLMNAMFNLVRAINKEADRCGKESGGFNEKEQIILHYLGKNEDVKMSDLAGVIDAPISTVTSIVNKLVENDLLNRTHSVEDRRIINVSLTSKGRSIFKKIHAQKDELSNIILSKLNEKEQAAMVKYVNVLASSLASR